MAAPTKIPLHSRIAGIPRKLLQFPLKGPDNSLHSLLDDCNGLLMSMPQQELVFDYLEGFSPSTPPAELASLRHDLSAYIHKQPTNFVEINTKERLEADIYCKWRVDLPQKFSLEDIKQLNARVTGSDGELRRTRAYLASNDGTPFIPMVGWRKAQRRLTEVPILFEEGELGQGLLAATRILALINNAHAFPDGNGRLGRFLFNLCLHRSGMPSSSYIPLKSLAILAHGGHEIRLRETELFDHWEGLISYHCNVIRFVHQVGALAITSRKGNSAYVQ